MWSKSMASKKLNMPMMKKSILLSRKKLTDEKKQFIVKEEADQVTLLAY